MKVLFLTGSRSDWGYIKPLLTLCKNKKIKNFLCVTNMLLLDSFGRAVNEIKKEGFKVDEEIYMTLDGYNTYTTSKSMGLFILSFTDILKKYDPDWVVLAGDRFETLAASISCAYNNIPIAHIQAGEVSGNIDGAARHAIGKFAHLHFASNKDAQKRLIKLGEEKYRIKVTGAPQLDGIKQIVKQNKNTFDKIKVQYDLPNTKNFLLVIFHSVTEEINKLKKYSDELIKSLNSFNFKKVWVLPNNDPGSKFIRDKILINRSDKNLIYENFPRDHFLSILKNCKAIVGNSSCGIIEAPTFKIPCVNIGRRQMNRCQGKNVINVKNVSKKNIILSVKKAMSDNFINNLKNFDNPYGDGNSAKKIIKHLQEMKNESNLLKKTLTY